VTLWSLTFHFPKLFPCPRVGVLHRRRPDRVGTVRGPAVLVIAKDCPLEIKGEADEVSLRIFATWRLRVIIVFEPVDDSRDAVFDRWHVEVDRQPKTLVGEPEIGEKLLLVDREERLVRSARKPMSIRTCSSPWQWRSRSWLPSIVARQGARTQRAHRPLRIWSTGCLDR
jgi:hypothetical protein